MNTRLIIICFSILLQCLIGCSHDSESLSEFHSKNSYEPSLVSRWELENRISQMTRNGIPFDWNQQPLSYLYSGLFYGDHLLNVGFKADFELQIYPEFIATMEFYEGKPWNQIKVSYSASFRMYQLRITSFKTLSFLKSLHYVRYLEISDFSLSPESVAALPLVFQLGEDDHYAPLQIPWNYWKHRIPEAQSYGSGQDVRVRSLHVIPKNNAVQAQARIYMMQQIFARPDSGINLSIAPNSQLRIDVIYTELDSQPWMIELLNRLITISDDPSEYLIHLDFSSVFHYQALADAIKMLTDKGKLLIIPFPETNSPYIEVFPSTLDKVTKIAGMCYANPNVQISRLSPDFALWISDAEHPEGFPIQYGEMLRANDARFGSLIFTGIVSLLKGRHANWSRNQILNRIRLASSHYPNQDSFIGFGYPDARRVMVYP